MSIEVERKFLIRRLPLAISELQGKVIEQGYVALEPGGHEVRLRNSNGQFTLTVKSSGDMVRQEYEIGLTQEQFEQLWPATEGRQIQKDRYVLSRDGYVIEVDVYHKPLNGLMVAEVEFASTNLANDYVKEPWMGEEVTHLSFLKNRRLLDFESFESLTKLL